MPDMSNKEMEVQLALGTLSPMRLFLKFLSMQNKFKKHDWDDERMPKITTEWGNGKPHDDNDIHVEISNETVFVFSSSEEFIGTYNYKG